MSDPQPQAQQAQQQAKPSSGGYVAVTRVRYAGKGYKPGDEIKFDAKEFSAEENKRIRERLEKYKAVKAN